MITHLGLIFIVIISYEVLRFFQFTTSIRKNLIVYKKIFRLFALKRTSDHWKQKAILNYSTKLILYSIKIIFFLLFIIILFMLLILIDNNFYNLILSMFGILETTILFTIYFFLRKYINEKL